jgi:hypothetical protein
MEDNGSSERHQNNNLKAIVAFARFLGPSTFNDVQRKEQIFDFLVSKIKPVEEDPDKKWIVTWNDYLHRIKHFLRWLYNQYNRNTSLLMYNQPKVYNQKYGLEENKIMLAQSQDIAKVGWQESGHELTIEDIQKAKEWLLHSTSRTRSSFA